MAFPDGAKVVGVPVRVVGSQPGARASLEPEDEHITESRPDSITEGPADRECGEAINIPFRDVEGLSMQTSTVCVSRDFPPPRLHMSADYERYGARMCAVNEMVERVAATDATILVWGESGVGKERVARLVHERSSRAHGPLVKVNCAALPLELLESELFGYERGAFTGAHRQKPGKFELADKGTILLDEIGEIPLPLQAKLLQVLQDGEFSRLGSRQDIRVDARVVALTNRDLVKLMERGQFREDLYYRINVVNIHVPPLRQRREEIPALVDHFMAVSARHYARSPWQISADTMHRLMEYSWPGNIRELENLVKRIVVFGSEERAAEELASRVAHSNGDAATKEGPPLIPHISRGGPLRQADDPCDVETLGLKEIARRAARQAERAALETVLERVRWRRKDAARRLKISYTALLYKMKEHHLGC
jgi:two-component system response regulator AtoC